MLVMAMSAVALCRMMLPFLVLALCVDLLLYEASHRTSKAHASLLGTRDVQVHLLLERGRLLVESEVVELDQRRRNPR